MKKDFSAEMTMLEQTDFSNMDIFLIIIIAAFMLALLRNLSKGNFIFRSGAGRKEQELVNMLEDLVVNNKFVIKLREEISTLFKTDINNTCVTWDIPRTKENYETKNRRMRYLSKCVQNLNFLNSKNIEVVSVNLFKNSKVHNFYLLLKDESNVLFLIIGDRKGSLKVTMDEEVRILDVFNLSNVYMVSNNETLMPLEDVALNNVLCLNDIIPEDQEYNKEDAANTTIEYIDGDLLLNLVWNKDTKLELNLTFKVKP